MVLHLLLALHENEGTVRGWLLFASLRDEPTLLLVVGNVAVVGRDSLKLDLDFALHGASDAEVVVAVDSLEDNLLLDKILVLVAADPGWASTESGRVLLILVRLLNDIVVGVGAHDVKAVVGLVRWLNLVCHLIEVVVDDLTEVNESVLLNLNLSVHIDLYTRGVNDSKIANVVLAILADNHELRLPKFLVVGDLVVVSLTLANLVDTFGTVNADFKVLKLLGIDSLETHVQLVSGSLVRHGLESVAAEVGGNFKLLLRELAQVDGGQIAVTIELGEARVSADAHAVGETANLHVLGVEFTLVDLNLILEGVVTDRGASIGNLLDHSGDLSRVLSEAEDEVASNGGILVRGHVLIVELRDLVHVSELTEGTEEVIGGDGGLALEESEPEDLGALGLEMSANPLGQIIVHDVLEVDLVKIVGPGVEHGEALVLYALGAVLLDVLLKELEVSLIGVDWVAQVISIDWLLLVADERANRLNARARLKILSLDREIENLGDVVVGSDADLTHDADEDLLETLKVPVLVDAGVDDAGVEHLLRLHSQQVAEVVDGVDFVV